MFSDSLPAETGLELQLTFEDGPDADWQIYDSSGNNKNVTARPSTSCHPDGLQCRSTACRIPVDSDRRVVCGDGVRTGQEACDDGNSISGDGCSNVCAVEPDWVCRGGEDLVSSDACEKGEILFAEDFEAGDAASWGWELNRGSNGLAATWDVAPSYKLGGQFGLRIRTDEQAATLRGCPHFIGNGVFGAGQGVSRAGASASASVVSWASTSNAGNEPAGTGFVLALGTAGTKAASTVLYTAEERQTDIPRIQPIWRATLWPPGSTSETFRVEAWLYVSGDWTATNTDVLRVEFLGGSAGTTIVASTVGEAVLPSVRNEWVQVIRDVTVTSEVKHIRYAVAGTGHTRGLLYATGLQVTRVCPGLPPGMAMWMKADAGIPQVDGQLVGLWSDQSLGGFRGVSSGAARPVLKIDHDPSRYAAGTSGREIEEYSRDVALPAVENQPSVGSMSWVSDEVEMHRPLTICVVDRRSIDGSSESWNRLLQAKLFNMVLGVHQSERGHYNFNRWIGSPEPSTEYTQDTRNYIWYWGVTCTSSNNREVRSWVGGVKRGEFIDQDYNTHRDWITLEMGAGGYNSHMSYRGQLGEIIAYRRELNEAERQNVELYLAHRWGAYLNGPDDSPTHPLVYQRVVQNPNTLDKLPSDESSLAEQGWIAPSTDALYPALLRRQRQALLAQSFPYGRRTVTGIDINSTTLLTFGVRVRRDPFYMGAPLWILVADAALANVAPNHPCFTVGEQCDSIAASPDNPAHSKFVRICVNGAQELGVCDELTYSPIDSWSRKSFALKGLFGKKYGFGARLPSGITFVLSSIAPQQSAEVFVDDLQLVNAGIGKVKANCPDLLASSRGGVSRLMDLSTVASPSRATWAVKAAASGGLTAAVGTSAGKDTVQFRGTVQSGLDVIPDVRGIVAGDARTSAVASTDQRYSQEYHASFRVSIGSGTTASTANDVPSLHMCSDEVRLQWNNDLSSWLYLFRTDAAERPPADFDLYTPSDLAPSTEFAVDVDRVWDLQRVKDWHVDGYSFAFWFKITQSTWYWSGIFFRGCSAEYQEIDLGDVYGGRDRQPGVWVRPHQSRLHVRKAEERHWNSGCDPGEALELGKWTHIAIVFKPGLLQVFYDGASVCATSMGGRDMFAPAIVAEPRTMGFGRCQGNSPYNFIRDFTHYPVALTPTQVRALASAEQSTVAFSSLTPGGPAANVRCFVTQDSVQVYENNVLMLNRSRLEPEDQVLEVQSPDHNDRPLLFRSMGRPGDAAHFDVEDIVLAERRENVRTPRYCPATGRMYKVVKHPDISYTDANNAARKSTYNGRQGRLAVISSSDEMACVTTFAACEKVWVSGRQQSGQWVTSDGDAKQLERLRFDGSTSLPFASSPSPTGAGGYLMLHPGECSASGGVRLGQMGECSDSCAMSMHGYVVEYPMPDEQAVDLLTFASGSTISASSSFQSSASSPTQADATGHLLGEPRPDDLAGWTFGAASGQTPQFLEADMGSPQQVYRVGVRFDLDGLKPGSTLSIHYKLNSSDSWTLFADLATATDAGDIVRPDLFSSRLLPVSARYLRFEFGAHSSATNTNPIRVSRLFAQAIASSYGKLLVRGRAQEPSGGYDPTFEGLKVAVVDQEGDTVKSTTAFPMSGTNHAEAFLQFIEGLDTGDTVMVAAQNMKPLRQKVFVENFNTRNYWDGIDRRALAAPGLGYFQYHPYSTWDQARAACAEQGAGLCSAELACSGKWYGSTHGYLHFNGKSRDGLAYMAVQGRDNWIAIGRGHTSAEICDSFDNVNSPSNNNDGFFSAYEDTYTFCCRQHEPEGGSGWEVNWEGWRETDSSVGNGSPVTGKWILEGARVRQRGRPWGDKDVGDTATISWSTERNRNTAVNAVQNWGGLHMFYNDPVALTEWNNYVFNAWVYPYDRHPSVTFRVQSNDTYYRFFAQLDLGSNNYACLFRSVNGVTSPCLVRLDDASFQLPPRRIWQPWEVTVLDQRIVIRVEGRVLVDYIDDDPAALTTGSIGIYNWFSVYDFYDSLSVELISSVNETALTSALSSLGIRGLGALRSAAVPVGDNLATGSSSGGTVSWSAIGQKRSRSETSSASHITSSVQTASAGEVARTTTLFTCRQQNVTIPENAAVLSEANVPLALEPGAQVGGFYIVNSGADAPFSVDTATGSVVVQRSEPLDFETNSTLQVQVAAQRALYDSGWVKFGSQAGSLSYTEIPHSVEKDPASLRVNVQVRAVDGPNKGFITHGTGGVFSHDGHYRWRYGGVHFGWGREGVRLWAPTRNLITPTGTAWNTGGSWGGIYENGVVVRSAWDQQSHLVEVKVTVEPEVQPDYDSGWFTGHAHKSRGSHFSVWHNFNQMPSRVRVLAKFLNGWNEGFVFEALGSAQVDNANLEFRHGAVIYGYNEQLVRIWLPTTRLGVGYALRTGDAWGGQQMPSDTLTVGIRVQAWIGDEDNNPPTIETTPFDLHALSLAHAEIEHNLDTVPARMQLVAQVNNGAGAGFHHDMKGTTCQMTAWYSNLEFGGVAYAYNETHARLWSASRRVGSTVSTSRAVWVRHGWGWDNEVDAVVATMRPRFWREQEASVDVVTANVQLLNIEEPPRATGPFRVIDENLPVGTVVADLSVEDGDCPDLSTCSLLFTSIAGNQGGVFSVDPATGEVIVADPTLLNYEYLREVRRNRTEDLTKMDAFIATAIEIDDGRLVSQTLPYFQVRDINDVPVLEKNPVRYILEESIVNTKVGTPIQGSDEDDGQLVLFSIVGGNVRNTFSIGSCSGQIRVRSPPDFEQQSEYNITVMALDDGRPPQNSTVVVRVVVENKNDPPEITNQDVYVIENSAVGSPLAVWPVNATDQDGDNLEYTLIINDDNDQFTIAGLGNVASRDTAQLYTTLPDLLNFEDPALNEFQLLVMVNDTEFQATALLTVHVLDANDPPLLVPGAQQLRVDENSPAGASIGVLSASDEDADTLVYAIASATPTAYASYVDVDPNTGALSVSLTGDEQFDFEAQSSFQLLVRVTDDGGRGNGFPLQHSEVNVTVRIGDINEQPLFLYPADANRSFSIQENTPPGTVIMEVQFFDEDVAALPLVQQGVDVTIRSGNQNKATGGSLAGPSAQFSALAGAGGSSAALGEPFEIVTLERVVPVVDPDNSSAFIDGLITVAELRVANDVIDFESTKQYDLLLRVEDDNADEPLHSSLPLQVNVTDRNDRPLFRCNASAFTAFSTPWLLHQGWGYEPTGGINLASPESTATAPAVEATTEFAFGPQLQSDQDAAMACSAACVAESTCHGFLYYSSQHPTAAFRRSCFFDRRETYSPPAYTPAAVAHVFGGAKQFACNRVRISEHSLSGTVLGTLQASDDETDAITLATPSTGVDGVLRATAAVQPDAGRSFVEQNTLTYNVVNQSLYTNTSNLANISYSVTEEFNVTVYEWVFTVQNAAAINYEGLPHSEEVLWLEVAAADLAGSGQSRSVWFAVELVDENDPPVWLPSETFQRTVPEETEGGNGFGAPLLAFDEDVDDSLTFTVDSTSDSSLSIDPSTGVLLVVADLPDLSASENRTMVVRVTDSTGAFITATVIVTISNENRPPRLTNGLVFRSVPELSPVGTIVATDLEASDGDGHDISWSVRDVTPLSNQAVRIERLTSAGGASTARLFVNTTLLNFERTPALFLEVRMLDAPPDPRDAVEIVRNIVVNVTDVNEEPDAGLLGVIRVNENTAPSSVLSSMQWRDPDEDGAALTITQLNLQSVFSLSFLPSTVSPARSAVSGIVAASEAGTVTPFTVSLASGADLNELNFEGPSPNYTINVQVSDGTNTVAGSIRVEVQDIAEAPMCGMRTYSIAERNSNGQIVIGNLNITDEDLSQVGTLAELNIAVVQNTPDGSGRDMFGVTYSATSNSHSLVLLSAARPDFERQQVATATVLVTDATALTDLCRVTVNIQDINDVLVNSIRLQAGGAELPADSLGTPGNQRLLIQGSNFGFTWFFHQANPSVSLSQAVVTYGGSDGLKYTAQNCQILLEDAVPGNTKIRCDSVAGVGRSLRVRVRIVPDASVGAPALGAVSPPVGMSSAPAVLSYAGPNIAMLQSGTFFNAKTTGGDTLVLVGTNFGPGTGVDADGLPTVQYLIPPDITPLYTADSCSVTVPHTEVTCRTVPGVGLNHTFSMTVAGNTGASVKLPSSFEPPSVAVLRRGSFGPDSHSCNASLTFAPSTSQVLDTDGSDFVTIEGANYGPFGGTHSITAAYGPTASEFRLTADLCTLVCGHTRVVCRSVPGIGGNHFWRLTVAGTPAASASADVTYYEPPRFVTATSSGDDASPIDTSAAGEGSPTPGGAAVGMAGSHFGPVTTSLPAELAVTYRMRYGTFTPFADAEISSTGIIAATDGNWSADPLYEYESTSCSVPAEDFLECSTVPGTGRDHAVQAGLTVCAADGISNCFTQWTSSVALNSLHYAVPVLGQLLGNGTDSVTQGGEELVLAGSNFGPLGSARIDRVQCEIKRDEDASSVAYPTVFQAANCTVTTAHTAITCRTVSGAGGDLRWTAVIDGQVSRAPTYGYIRPVIHNIAILRDGAQVPTLSTGGGDTVIINGTNFGSNLTDLTGRTGSITYGAGRFVCSNITILVPHKQLSCVSSPGVGAGLGVVVTVATQRSPLSTPPVPGTAVSYDVPRIFNLQRIGAASAAGNSTAGNDRFVVTGENFGYSGERPKVLFKAADETIASARRAIILGVPTSSRVEFLTPAGAGRDVEVIVSVAGSLSNRVLFHYSPPVITQRTGVVVLDDIARAKLGLGAIGNSCTLLDINGFNFGASRPSNFIRRAATSANLDVDALALLPSATPTWDAMRRESIDCGFGADKMIWSHTKVRLAVGLLEGRVWAQVAAQTSAAPLFTNVNPSVRDVQVLDGGAVTNGGFRIRITATNLGDVSAVSPQIRTYFRDVDGGLQFCGPDGRAADYAPGNPLASQSLAEDSGKVVLGTIVCEAPPGQGTVDVIVVRSSVSLQGNSSADDASLGAPGILTYAAPVIESWGVSGASAAVDAAAAAAGSAATQGLLIRIKGSNFGLTPQVLIQDTAAPGSAADPFWEAMVAVNTSSHNDLAFNAPDGVGENLVLKVVVGGQTSAMEPTVLLSYAPPTFDNVEIARYVPAGGRQLLSREIVDKLSTRGDEEIVITGRNFGPFERRGINAQVNMSGNTASIALYCDPDQWTSTRVVCNSTLGAGLCLNLIVRNVRGTTNIPTDCTAGLPGLRVDAVTYKPPTIALGTTLPVLGTRATMRQVDVFSSALDSDVSLFQIYTDAAKGRWPDEFGEVDFLPGSIAPGPAVLKLVGENFAAEGSVRFSDGNGFSVEYRSIDADMVLLWDHEVVYTLLPPGAGGPFNFELISGASGNQVSSNAAGAAGATGLQLQYTAPVATAQTEVPSVPTDGCYQFLDKPGELDTCCSPAVVRVQGSNLGKLPSGSRFELFSTQQQFAVRVGGRKMVTLRCSQLRQNSPGSLSATNGEICPADCLSLNKFDGRCETYRTAVSRMGGQPNGEGCCEDTYSYSSRSLTSEAFCKCRVPLGECIVAWDHDEVIIRPPSGFGRSISLEVIAADTVSSTQLLLDYDAPKVTFAQPQPVDALGGTILSLYGQNFGASRQSVDIALNEFPCAKSEWLLGPTGPYLECEMAPVKVGWQNINVTVNGTVTGITSSNDTVLYTRCVPGFFGLPEEFCEVCKIGANCSSFENDLETPWSETFWWRTMLDVPNENCLQRATNLRSQCPHYIPCEPADSCAGNNTCSERYRGERCALCSLGNYRLDGECIPCPENAWVLIVVGVLMAAGLGFAAYNLNKREVHTGVASIIVDYFQVLALFSRSKVPWPTELLQLFRFMSLFSFNIELTAPECSIPDLEYTNKWYGTMALPLLAISLFGLMHLVLLFYKRVVLGRKKDLNRHLPTLISTTLMMLYFLYLHLTRTIFDVFNCNPTDPPDGKLYLEVVFEECGVPGGTQMRLLPYAIVALLFYTIGYPSLVLSVMKKYAVPIQSDIVLMAMKKGDNRGENPHAYDVRKKFKRLYYIYSYEYFWWNLVIILRKLSIALSGLMFRRNPAFQLAMVLLVLFASFTIHIINKPYVGKTEWPIMVAKYWEGIKKGSSKEKAIEKLLKASSIFDQRKKVKKTSKLGEEEEVEITRGQDADRFWQEKGWVKFITDYNIVEAILLTTSVVVCVSGIMFQSGQLDSEGAQFAAQRTALLVIVMGTIIGSIIYIALVAYAVIKGDDAFAQCRPKKKDDMEAKLSAKHAAMRGDREKKQRNSMAMNNNPLLMKAAAQQTLSGSELPNSRPPQTLWTQIKSHYGHMEDTLARLKALKVKAEGQRARAEAALRDEEAAKRTRRFSRKPNGNTKANNAILSGGTGAAAAAGSRKVGAGRRRASMMGMRRGKNAAKADALSLAVADEE